MRREKALRRGKAAKASPAAASSSVVATTMIRRRDEARERRPSWWSPRRGLDVTASAVVCIRVRAAAVQTPSLGKQCRPRPRPAGAEAGPIGRGPARTTVTITQDVPARAGTVTFQWQTPPTAAGARAAADWGINSKLMNNPGPPGDRDAGPTVVTSPRVLRPWLGSYQKFETRKVKYKGAARTPLSGPGLKEFQVAILLVTWKSFGVSSREDQCQWSGRRPLQGSVMTLPCQPLLYNILTINNC